MHFDIIIKNGKVLVSDPKDPYQLIEESTDIGISKGYITKIGSLSSSHAEHVFKADGLHILPGLIDTQVHFREPGMEHKEDMESGSRSALLGGITAFFDMPNTHPPTVTIDAFNDKIKRAESRSWCDFAFFAGASPENIHNLPALAHQKHCCGVKIFMGSSTGSLLLHETEKLDYVLQTISKKTAIHSEDEQRLRDRKKIVLSDPGKVHLHPTWRDPECALISTKQIVKLAHKHLRQVHILHVTTKEEIQFLTQHKNAATVEVTPQHLTLTAPECYNELGTLAQMNPPIRDKEHCETLWEGINSGVVTMLGSDHSPHSLEEKQKTYPETPSGMPGTQTMLTLMLDHVNQQKLSLKTLTTLLAVNPHRYYKIEKQGLIKEGFKANITIIDLKKKKRISQKWLASKCNWSPFENKETTGWPIAVLLNGQWAMREDQLIDSPKGKPMTFL